MKIYIDTVASLPDAELPKPEADHEYTILKTVISEPKIGLFEIWRMKKFIEKSYIVLREKKLADDKLKEQEAPVPEAVGETPQDAGDEIKDNNQNQDDNKDNTTEEKA